MKSKICPHGIMGLSNCISCVKEKSKAYRQKNRSRLLEKKREYYLKNAEKIKKQRKEYRLNNRSEYLEYMKQWRQKNKEHIRAYKRLDYQKNKDKYKVQRKGYFIEYTKRPEVKVRNFNKRFGTTLTTKEYLKMQEEQNHKCAICRVRPIEQIDHDSKTKIIRGLLCRKCNSRLVVWYESLSKEERSQSHIFNAFLEEYLSQRKQM